MMMVAELLVPAIWGIVTLTLFLTFLCVKLDASANVPRFVEQIGAAYRRFRQHGGPLIPQQCLLVKEQEEASASSAFAFFAEPTCRRFPVRTGVTDPDWQIRFGFPHLAKPPPPRLNAMAPPVKAPPPPRLNTLAPPVKAPPPFTLPKKPPPPRPPPEVENTHPQPWPAVGPEPQPEPEVPELVVQIRQLEQRIAQLQRLAELNRAHGPFVQFVLDGHPIHHPIPQGPQVSDTDTDSWSDSDHTTTSTSSIDLPEFDIPVQAPLNPGAFFEHLPYGDAPLHEQQPDTYYEDVATIEGVTPYGNAPLFEQEITDWVFVVVGTVRDEYNDDTVTAYRLVPRTRVIQPRPPDAGRTIMHAAFMATTSDLPVINIPDQAPPNPGYIFAHQRYGDAPIHEQKPDTYYEDVAEGVTPYGNEWTDNVLVLQRQRLDPGRTIAHWAPMSTMSDLPIVHATAPGYVLLDTGCTSPVVFEANLPEWHAELLHAASGKLSALPYQDNMCFKGISGPPTASKLALAWPCYLGAHLGILRTSILPGATPALLSLPALKTLGAIIDTVKGVLHLLYLKADMTLSQSANGHLFVYLFKFPSELIQDLNAPNIKPN